MSMTNTENTCGTGVSTPAPASRRATNKQNAFRYSKFGLYGFVSNGKIPLIPRYNKSDSEMSQEERDAAVAEYREKHGEPPVHVGATRDEKVIRAMFARFPDAVWSLATGPSGLVVVDADRKDDGVTKLRELFRQHGGMPAGCVEVPTKSGGAHFYFRDPQRKYSNKAGLLKSECGCDVRGTSGQVVSPGSVLEDGSRYGTALDQHHLRMAISKNELPELPDYIDKKINAGPTAAALVNPSQERELIKQLDSADSDENSHAFDQTLGDYDLDALLKEDARFSRLYKEPSSDHSTNRFNAARRLMLQWPQLSVIELGVFFQSWDGAGRFVDRASAPGEYDNRQIAREWLKCKGLGKASTGEAFGAVDDPEDADFKRQVEDERDRERAVEERSLLLLGSDLVRQYQPPDWFVQNLLAPRTVGAISGPSNVGKSFSALDLAWHIVNGHDWYGLKVERSGVLYAYGEGRLGIASRLLALSRAKGTAEMVVRDGIPNFAINPKAAVKALKRAVEEANKMLSKKGSPPIKLLILDTFAKATAGAEENSAKDMGVIMAALRQLADELGVCVLIIHHTTKGGSQGLRGSSAIVGDLDFNIEVLDHDAGKARRPNVSVPKGQLCLQVAKMRDGRKGTKLFFKLEPVILEKDKWGDDVVSMVARPVKGALSGEAFGDVRNEDVAPKVEDKLSEQIIRDQHIRADALRKAQLREIAAAIKEHGVRVGPRHSIKVQSLAERVDCLREIKETAGASNLVRRIRDNFFLKDAEVDLEAGRLLLDEPKRRGSSARFVLLENVTVH
jgi:hypothetical protein